MNHVYIWALTEQLAKAVASNIGLTRNQWIYLSHWNKLMGVQKQIVIVHGSTMEMAVRYREEMTDMFKQRQMKVFNVVDGAVK